MRSSSSPSLRCMSSSACVKRATSGSVGVRPALLSVLPISRRTTTCAHATTQTTNAVPMAQLGMVHTLHPLRGCCAAKRRRSESNRRIEVLQTSALPLGYGARGLGKCPELGSFSTHRRADHPERRGLLAILLALAGHSHVIAIGGLG